MEEPMECTFNFATTGSELHSIFQGSAVPNYASFEILTR
jgi:hypothetical protein